jgi:hypothetical protein
LHSLRIICTFPHVERIYRSFYYLYLCSIIHNRIDMISANCDFKNRTFSRGVQDYLHETLNDVQEGQRALRRNILHVEKNVSKLCQAFEDMTVKQEEKQQGILNTSPQHLHDWLINYLQLIIFIKYIAGFQLSTMKQITPMPATFNSQGQVCGS